MELKDKRILITGATGQVAAAFARGLAPQNEVFALARFSRPGSREALEAAGVRTCFGDFVTGDFGEAPEKVDYVVHAAANTRPKDADTAMRDNVEGSGLLMARYCEAKGYLHVSATGCYAQHPDPTHRYTEDEDLTGDTRFSRMYGPSKVAGEGVARTLARVFGLPTTIARLNVAYGGPYDDGGLPGRLLDQVIRGDAIMVPKTSRCVMAPIHEDDLTAHVAPLLAAASVPATIVNWGGDDPADLVEIVSYLGELTGKTPNLVYDDASPWPSWVGDNTRRRSLGCECKTPWRDGLRRMVAARHPEIVLSEPA